MLNYKQTVACKLQFYKVIPPCIAVKRVKTILDLSTMTCFYNGLLHARLVINPLQCSYQYLKEQYEETLVQTAVTFSLLSYVRLSKL